jgi:hypothetical protein
LGGTVTSVTGTSPVLSSGGTTPAISLAASYGDTQNPYASKTANYILAAPNGSAGVPTFRAIVANDIPTLNQNTSGTAAGLSATLAVSSGGTGLSSLTSNSVLLGNASSTIQFVSPGSNGNVLTSNGTTWLSSAPSGGGSAMTLISTQTVSGSSISWTGLSGYNNYLLIFNNVTTAGSAYTINLSVGTGSGPTYLSSNYNYVNSIDEGLTLTNIIQSQNGAGNILLTGINYTGIVSGAVYLSNFTNSLYFGSSGILSTSTSNPAIANSNSGIQYTSTAQKTAIKLNTSGLSFGSGTVSLYGISS